MSSQRTDGSGLGAVGFLVAQVGAFASAGFAARIAPLGLAPAHAGILRVIAAQPGRSQQAIAQQLGIVPSRLVVLIDALEGDGLVQRRRDLEDRRNYALHLTTAGQDKLREIGVLAGAHAEALLAPLSDPDKSELARILQQLADHHGLTRSVHPGFSWLGREDGGSPTR